MAKDPYRYFRVEARDLLTQMSDAVLAAENGDLDQQIALPSRMLRWAHTLKGAASVVRLPEIAAMAHAIEDLLTPLRDAGQALSRIDLDATLVLIDEALATVSALAAPSAAGSTASAATAAGGSQSASPPLGAGQASSSPSASDATLAPHIRDASSPATPPPAEAAKTAETAEPPDVDALPLPIMEIPQVATQEVDTLSDSIAETLTHVITLQRLAAQITELREALPLAPEDLVPRLLRIEEHLERGGRQLERELLQARDHAEQLRLAPASVLFGPLQRAARDAARAVGKQVQFHGSGGDVKLEGGVLNAALGALVQMIRNAVAHGIETPEERLAAGKPAAGRIELQVIREGRQIRLRCQDDGAGLDLEALRRTALAKGVPNAATLDEQGLIDRLLRGGLSTARQVNTLAGRGVGMDLVRDTAERLGGQLSLRSTRGQGTTLELRVPLRLGAVRALGVLSEGVAAWVPLDAVEQVVQQPQIHGQQLMLGQDLLPYVRLSELLMPTRPAPARLPATAVLLRCGERRAALGVDAVDGVSTVVWRPPPDLLPPSPVVTGLTLDAAQQPLAVLSPDGLIEAARRARPLPVVPTRSVATILVIDDSLTTRMLEQSILEAAGYRVHMASSAEDGLEAVRREAYALVLVDVEMPPGMDGFSFVAQLRADEALRDLPAVLVSSRNAPEDLARGVAVGADGYIIKGEFSQNSFLDKVAELVARSQVAGLERRARQPDPVGEGVGVGP
ncbi:hybrid sensor histidine kinase/response regulator [Roseateles depolymerans]|uniref:Chemotaxis protein CheA n=1 Tax=Roseateles depolymerans TaxID=76731 RepID=A0A0U3N0C6_9BURK|nr:hybrid sensor histidine kinase/response regulator [Roseateles depolymerans]ALV05675.1 Chemotaxis protein histidine kinase-like protein [Roseateles depolymerans]REG13055.1 two-component system chemotaxis sensor kinase CheA [Roseateles depolymerans]